jgi:glycosyltransferase involved in cell wall biosynthesis
LDAWFGRTIKRRTMRAAALVATSEPVHRELVAAGYPRDRIHPIAHGTDPQPARDAASRSAARQALAADQPALALTDDTPLAVFVGRLRSGRGLSSLLAAWQKVAARRPRARLWLVGDGPQAVAIQQRIDAMNLGDRIALVGQFDEVDTILAAADLFVLPSPEKDLSVALLEAMAVGLPAVVCDNGGNREVVEDERQGLLVPPGDSDALAAAVGRLLDRPELARRLGKAARQSVQERFSLARMVEGHVALFENLLGGPSAD